MPYNPLHKLRDNIAAIRIALRDTTAGAEELAALRRYSGFGGIKAILYPAGTRQEWLESGASNADMKLYDGIQELHGLLKEHYSDVEYKSILDSLRHSVLTAFYTPAIVPQTLYAVLAGQGTQPKRFYEPSAGAGVFITEAVKHFDSLEKITAVEKDILSAKILQAISKALPVSTTVHGSGLEATPNNDNGQYDLVASNIPFGNFAVYDPAFADPGITDRIHNYFFAKGLEKVSDGGLLAYITTDAFLNSPSNEGARNYLFERADFVSLAVMPDNLMKETGNTEAPNHLLVVQKNNSKKALSPMEESLAESIQQRHALGTYPVNRYIAEHPACIAGSHTEDSTNQYGQPNVSVWQDGDINLVGEKLQAILEQDFRAHFDKQLYQHSSIAVETIARKELTFLPLPENTADSDGIQLGLFDTGAADTINRALAYISPADQDYVQKQSARIAGIARTTERPEHESIVLLTARSKNSPFYTYRLYSNLKEIECPAYWQNASGLAATLQQVSRELQSSGYDFHFEGDKHFEPAFGLSRKQIYVADLRSFYKEGTLTVYADQPGTLHDPDFENDRARFEPLLIPGKSAQFFIQYVNVRDAYFSLVEKENDGNEFPDGRNLLNDHYRQFQASYGMLNHAANRKHILNDSLGFITLSSVERKEGEQYVPSDIFNQPLFKKQQAFSTDDPVEALAHCLNERGAVDITFIAGTTGNSEAQTIQALHHHIYLNPATDKWETADQYLSGNVVKKLEEAATAINTDQNNFQYQRSIAAIEKVQPEKIPFELLDFNLGERWMPVSYYEQYARELFESDVAINYLSSIDSFKVVTGRDNARITEEFAVRPKNGSTMYGGTLLEHALENTAPFFTYEIETTAGKIRLPDNEATQLAHQKIEQVRTRFAEWLSELPAADKQTIEKLYNDTFNCFVLREYDGSHLSFPGLDKAAVGISDLYPSQKNAAWRIIQNRGALIDHEVGLGKTLTMITASYEMKRLGIVHKPLIIALKANIAQVTEAYRKAYPSAKVLAPCKDDFTPARRQQIFHAIKNNNWDCIILTHDQFGKIPQSPEVQRAIFQQELDNLTADLHTLKDMGGELSKRMLKGLEVRRNNLQVNLTDVLRRIEEKKDTDINFKELGIDHLFVDEAHKYKNLTFTTRHSRVAGLGNQVGSQKALNMLFAIRTLQQKFDSDLCATFLSGTPISNSLTEMYLLFKYLRPNEMERQRIENFDGWAAVFAKKTTDFEFSVTNEINAKERFRHFIKVPELALFYNEITDYKTARHIQLDKPQLAEELVNIAPTDDQRAFTRNLMAFARSGDAKLIGRAPLSEEEDKGRMLIATNYAKKMAVDMRLVDPSLYDDHPGNKVSVCAAKVHAMYQLSHEHRGTQIIFSDIGTPKPDEFNIYDAMKDKLVNEYSIPANQISFIHEWNETRKPELFRKMNQGHIRILIGSTEKAGTGLNVQQRVVAMHHLDIPWKPSELEQRNGRGARQGNLIAKQFYNNEVKNYIYAVEQSLDNYKFNLLKNKQTFISQMKNCELHVRSIDEGAMDEKSGMNFSEYIAILSGDTTLLEKSKVEKKIAVTESLRSVHHKEIARSRFRLEQLGEEHSLKSGLLANARRDEALYKASLAFDKDGVKENPLRLKELTSADAETLGREIIRLYQHWKPTGGNDTKIGELYGFNCYIREQRESLEDKGLFSYRKHNGFYVQHPGGGIKYTWNQGHPSLENSKLAARHFLNALDRVTKVREQYEREIKELETTIPVLQTLLQKPFDKEEELRLLKQDLSRIERELTLKIQAQQLLKHEDEKQISVRDGEVIQDNKKKVYYLNNATV